MDLLCLGLNHKTARVEHRELFAVANHQLGQASMSLKETGICSEAVVISTCNRTEFYAITTGSESLKELQATLIKGKEVSQHISEHFYYHHREHAAQHLCEVISGLDSMILGETEIVGQVKTAYQAAHASGATSANLNRLFQNSFRIAKKIRTETSIQEGATSVGNVAVHLAEKIFGHLKDSEVMLLGAGEMSRLTAKSLISRGAKSIIVSNRSFDKAQQLAEEMGGKAIRFDDWQQALERVDVIISSTGAPHAIMHKQDIERSRSKRKYRPLFLIDIAVPRDIDPAVQEIEEVYLYDIDSLEQLAEEARLRRQDQITVCQTLIQQELEKLAWWKS